MPRAALVEPPLPEAEAPSGPAAEVVGRTVRDHEMPLLRALTPAPVAVPIPPSVAAMADDAPPATEPSSAEQTQDARDPSPEPAVEEGEAPIYEPTTGELEVAAPPVPEPVAEEAPMPRLRAPSPTRDASATLVDFRMPASFHADLQRARAEAAASPSGVESGPSAGESGEIFDAEEFPGLVVAEAPPEVQDTARPGALPVLPLAASEASPVEPVAVELAAPEPDASGDDAAPGPSVAEILPLSSLSPSSPLRVARIIEPIEDDLPDPSQDGDEDIEIPSSPGGDAGLELTEAPLFGSDVDQTTPPPAARGPVDLNALDDVDLDSRIEEVDEVEDISVSDVADLDPVAADVLQSGELEAIRPEGPRAAPPPLKELDVRFVLRPLSNNLSDARLISIGEHGLTIGRSDAEFCLGEDTYLSPRHLALTVSNDALFAEDLGTLNGTWIRVRSQVELRPGDHFRVGHQLLRLDSVPPVLGRPEGRDGTRRYGAPRDGVRLCMTQLGDDGEARNRYHLGEQGARIGRHIADVVFTDDTFMSGTHAVVLPRGDRAVLRDLSSRNGTWVRLAGRTHLVVGDAVMLGQTVWRVSRPVT